MNSYPLKRQMKTVKSMRKLLIFSICAFVLNLLSMQLIQAQTQTIRGSIVDKETRQPLSGASVKLVTQGADTSLKAVADAAGEFSIDGIPLGRHNLLVQRNEYKELLLQNIVVISGKEVVLNIELESEIQALGAATIKVRRRQTALNNENALVSGRLFTVDETDRFAGSRGDPARMASNFAGVQGADDSRNDIVVRGNSPAGVLWRMEGIDIPNPNHFAIPGTSGGPLSIINNKMLANSDFFTGAFTAEYNNSTAGAFDLKMRNGNTRKREHSTQFGLFGWDVLTEGPFSKKSKASYLVSYRYSTLAIFNLLNIQLGTDAVPRYQDASFKLNFPLKKGNLSFFGLGGASTIDILISNQKESSSELYGDDDRDQYFRSNMGIVGGVYTRPLGNKSYLNVSVAGSRQAIQSFHELVFRRATDTFLRDGLPAYRYELDSLVPNQYYRFLTSTQGTHIFINTKFSSRLSMRYGAQITRYGFNFRDSGRNFDFADTGVNGKYWKWFDRWNSVGSGLMLMPYAQLKWKPNVHWQVSFGLTSQVFRITEQRSGQAHTSADAIQPRLGIRYQINRRSSVNFGTGRHSQIQPGYAYYYLLPGNKTPHNLGMGLTNSNHFVLGFDQVIGKDKRFRTEVYYQQLSNIPVGLRSGAFSLANTGSGFSRFFPDTLQNTGTGRNYGVEFTFDKAFNRGYFYMLTLSLFEAKYTGSDGIERNSDFNTNYAFNVLFGKEWKTGPRSTINVGGKLTMAGARRFSPMDTLASMRQREYVEVDALKNTQRFGRAYSRTDIRIAYRINAKKISHEIAFDLVNVGNRQNILKYSYTSDAPYFREEYQLGFLPVFYYKVDF